MVQSVLSFVDPAICCYKNTDNYKYSPFPSAMELHIFLRESQVRDEFYIVGRKLNRS